LNHRFGAFPLVDRTFDLRRDGEAVWDGRIVSDATLRRRVSRVRSAIGGTGQAQVGAAPAPAARVRSADGA